MTVNRTELVKALEVVMPGTATESILAGGSRVTIYNNRLYTTRDILSISTPFVFPESLEVSVSADDFFSVLKRFTEENIQISVKDNSLIVKAGRAKATMRIYPMAKNSPLFFESPTLIELPSDYFDAIVSCYIPGNKTTHAGVFFEGMASMSTDGKRINYVELSKDSPRFWINDLSAKTLIRMGNVFTVYGVSPSHVWFVSDTATIAVKRLNDEKYQSEAITSYYSLCKASEVDHFDVPEGLYEATMRAAPFTTLDDALYPVTLNISKEGIEVNTKGNADSYEEFVEYLDPLDIAEVSLKVDYAQFLYGLKKSTLMGVRSITKGDHNYLMLVLYGANSTLMINTLRE